ncbi:MAG: alpha/beta hydrolase [Fibrobacteres bacterium]|nr:alpha/beta hydrolase [Fibrobacterota bacterium]
MRTQNPMRKVNRTHGPLAIVHRSAQGTLAALAALAVLSFLPAPLRAQGSGITITGTVTDPNGARLKDAKVILLGRKLTVRTDANGVYTFAGIPTGIGGQGRPSRQTAPAAEGGELRFRIDGAARNVRVSVFTMAGGLVLQAADERLGDGEYRINPFRPGLAPGSYLVRLQIGAERHTLTLPYVDGLATAAPQARRIGEPGISMALRKTAAAADTISVVAMGFERAERLVESFGGTQDFKLNALRFTNIQYKSGTLNAAEKYSCILDIHMPKPGTGGARGWPVVLHFHGGGMTGGDRNEAFGSDYNNFGQKFLDAGVMEIAPGYRLIGAGTWPDYIRDAVAASIWIRKNIEPYGGDPNSVFITGFSAGAYLTHMMAIDTTWFGEAKFDPANFAGFVSLSGQTRQHENIRNDLKVKDIMAEKPYAMPMGHIRKTVIPWQIFVGGNEGGTVTDNKAMYDALIKAGSTDLYFDVIPNQPHTVGDMAAATSIKRDKFLAFINKYKAK